MEEFDSTQEIMSPARRDTYRPILKSPESPQRLRTSTRRVTFSDRNRHNTLFTLHEYEREDPITEEPPPVVKKGSCACLIF